MSKKLERLEEFAVDVILERRYGKRAALLRTFLFLLSRLYERIMRWRLLFYERRWVPVHALGCMVVSVGNLTVGGTGKTPLVEKIARSLTRGGRRVAILTRGYKSAPRPWSERLRERFGREEDALPPRIVSDGRSLFLDSELAGDEPFMLAHNLHHVVVLVDKNRVKSGLFALKKFGVDTLLLDDGFQYLPLKERYDVVLIDRESPFGNERILPRGMLREPPDHLKRANLIVITKCNGSDLEPLRKRIRALNRHAPIIECRHKPLYLQDIFTEERKELDFLKELRVGTICGIAKPESFEEGMRRLGAEIVFTRQYADHHRFSMQEIQSMLTRSRTRGARAVMTTEKDAVRMPHVDRPIIPIYFLRVEIEIIRGQEIFDEFIARACHQSPATQRLSEAELLESMGA